MAERPQIHNPETQAFPLQIPNEQGKSLELDLDLKIAQTKQQILECEEARRKNWEEIEARPENQGLQDLDMRSTSEAQRKTEDYYVGEIIRLNAKLENLLRLQNKARPETIK